VDFCVYKTEVFETALKWLYCKSRFTRQEDHD
jgi:hypothetical protein